MCASIVDSKNLAKKAPIDIKKELKPLLTDGDVHEQRDFDMEIQYLIDSGFFKRHASHFVIPTAKGIDQIWGQGVSVEEKLNDTSPAGLSISNSSNFRIKNFQARGYKTGIRMDNISDMDMVDSSSTTKTTPSGHWHEAWWGKLIVGILIIPTLNSNT